ncbi:MAG: NAD(P)H-hydrate dehydratase, partial [Candidatus Hodarchaeota archaeon]
AIDCPTGVDPQTGETKTDWIKASCTIALHKKKLGLTSDLCGKIVVASIGMPKEVDFIVGPGDLLAIPPKSPEAHKGDSGKILVIGGSREYTGAPALVALAALRGGTDLVIIAAPEEVVDSVRSYSPELIVRGFEGSHFNSSSVKDMDNLLSWADVVVIGPGLGIGTGTKEAVQNLVKKLTTDEKATIIDADALKFVTKDLIGNKAILTPHAGEFFALTKKTLPSVSQNLSERWKQVKKAAKKWNCTFLVKGKWDIIADQNESKINLTGCPEMTIGGTGDVLAGLTAALYARCRDPFYSATAAAFLNGKSGEIALKEEGSASPLRIINAIPWAIREAKTYL